MDKLKVVKGRKRTKFLVGLHISKLSREDQRLYLEFIEQGLDPRELSFWPDIMRLYPAPKLAPATEVAVKFLIKEQLC
jgi:hypothetical protein